MNFSPFKVFSYVFFASIFLSACKSDEEVKDTSFDSSFTYDGKLYNINTSEIFWKEEFSAITAMSYQGTAIILAFNEKPSATQRYNIVKPADLSLDPNNCAITLITKKLETIASTGAKGSIMDVEIKDDRIYFVISYVEMVDRLGVKKSLNASFNSLISK